MRILDGKYRSPLTRISGAALMLMFAAGIAASIPKSHGAADDLRGTEAAKISRTSDTHPSPDPATTAATASGITKEIGNGETSLLLDWHSDANNMYGDIPSGEPLHPQQ